jgi:hypothetical protein
MTEKSRYEVAVENMTDKQKEACRLLGITTDEWWFCIGRYLHVTKELSTLRVGVARIAQYLDVDGVHGSRDTGYQELHKRSVEIDRGWNALCAAILNKLDAWALDRH